METHIFNTNYIVIHDRFPGPSAKASGAAKAIRERWKNGMLYTIAVNSHLLEGDRKRCIEAWTDDYYI
jgi:hypothetical protein